MQQLREKERICERNNAEDVKVSAGGWGGTAPGTRTATSLQLMVTGCPAADHEGLHAEADCILKEGAATWKACMGTGF